MLLADPSSVYDRSNAFGPTIFISHRSFAWEPTIETRQQEKTGTCTEIYALPSRTRFLRSTGLEGRLRMGLRFLRIDPAVAQVSRLGWILWRHNCDSGSQPNQARRYWRARAGSPKKFHARPRH